MRHAACEKFSAGSLFRDAAVLEHHDAAERMNGGEAMSNDKSGAAPHEFRQRRHDGVLGGRIQRAGRFIEEQNRSVLRKARAIPMR